MDRAEARPRSDTGTRPSIVWAAFYMLLGCLATLAVVRMLDGPSLTAELEDCQRLVQHQAELIGRYAEKADRCDEGLP